MDPDFHQYWAAQPDEDLIRAYYFEREKYEEAALGAVAHALAARGLDADRVGELRKLVSRQIDGERKRRVAANKQKPGCLGTGLDLLLNGI